MSISTTILQIATTEKLKIAKIAKESMQTKDDPVRNCIQAYSNHPSILRIKGMVNAQEKFVFSHVEPSTVFSEIQKMNATKKTSGAVPTDKLKLASNICYKEIAYHINNAIDMNVFPDILKLADVSPIFKNGESTTVVNYRRISVFSSLSKFMKDFSQNKYYLTLANIYQICCVVFARNTVHKMP